MKQLVTSKLKMKLFIAQNSCKQILLQVFHIMSVSGMCIFWSVIYQRLT